MTNRDDVFDQECEPDLPDEAHDAALAAAREANPPRGEETVLAALTAAAPHMPT